ncbi:response regulator transcription factor [Actibacterium sp. 188UL27-1]|uniref:response regulator transcription factor n=1 Tax=Actibacterium sp. 188UL27-1 TaxID=2786961 RepID=UPI00195C7CB6|nr:response regulator transcription factor [Actibacterium sp. 188UL27-1]MBM7068414.1 response regulator transcription factor [Actibacterium sp. 188UL27-1]
MIVPALATALVIGVRSRRPHTATTDPHSFAFGPVTINAGLRILADASGARDLTERDPKLLSCFRENPRFVLTKDALYDAGWRAITCPTTGRWISIF